MNSINAASPQPVAYEAFLASKRSFAVPTGFTPTISEAWKLYPWQAAIVDWACRRGRAAIFADCFAPGTLVRSGESYRPIEDLKVGDPIETLSGPATVERKMSRNYSGPMVEVQTASGYFPLKVTPNHKFYVLRRSRCIIKIKSRANTLCSTGCDRLCPSAEKKPHTGYRIELARADELTLDDCLLYRQPREKFGRYTSSPAYLRMAGYWLAEGWLSRNAGKLYGIHFGFNINEEATLASDTLADLRELGIEGRIERNKEFQNVVIVSASSNWLAERLAFDFGEGSGKKRLPAWFPELSRADQLTLLTAYFKGDGHINEKPPSPDVGDGRLSQSIRSVTVSYALAAGVRDALLGLGIRCSTMTEEPKVDSRGTSHRMAYRILIPRRFMGEFGFPVETIRRDLRQVEHEEMGQRYTLIPIRSLSRSHYEGPVYNLTSSGHDSYLTDAGTSKNCGLGKSAAQLAWAALVCEHTGGDVLILAPLAVATQTVREGKKFGIEARYCRSADEVQPGITITNYEMLAKFDASRFAGVVIDESSILKSFDGKTRTAIIQAFSATPYRLACTATPAPNDHMELGNHAEFLGIMNRSEMLAKFFIHDGGSTKDWRLKGHAERDFWRWVCSWAVAVRKPSDLGYDDGDFILPPLHIQQHVVEHSGACQAGRLFADDARTLGDQRKARQDSAPDRVKLCADLVNANDEPFLVWCDLNAEGDALVEAIPDAVQVAGSDSSDVKEQRMLDFAAGKIRVLVTKPKIAGFGLNWQHCPNVAFVGLSHSFESFYQAVRRCWRFGQTKPVRCHVITSELEGAVVRNIEAKERAAAVMSEQMVASMAAFRDGIGIVGGAVRESLDYTPATQMLFPRWLAPQR